MVQRRRRRALGQRGYEVLLLSICGLSFEVRGRPDGSALFHGSRRRHTSCGEFAEFSRFSCIARENVVQGTLVECECSRQRAKARMLLSAAFTATAPSSGYAFAADSRGPEAVYPACTHAAKGRVQQRCCSEERWSSVRRPAAQSPSSKAGNKQERRCPLDSAAVRRGVNGGGYGVRPLLEE